MIELEDGIILTQVGQEAAHTKSPLAYIRIVQDNDRTVRELRKPCIEIMLHCLAGVEPVDVEQIDRVLIKIFAGLVKGRSHQAGESRVKFIVVCSYGLEYFFSVKAGVFVTFPSVDRITARLERELLDRLTESEV